MKEMRFEEPREVADLRDCFFYHVMDLPGFGEVGEHWDLRETVDSYLGPYNFAGRRVLDVGAGSGFLTFEMEKLGADVVSFDLGKDADWDVVPFVDEGPGAEISIREKRKNVERLKNSYWLAHKLLHSKAQVYYGDVYDLPPELGRFDAAFIGAILLHLRDPFRALHSVSKLVDNAMIVTDFRYDDPDPVMRLLPNKDNPENRDTWWQISTPCMRNMLSIIGFADCAVSHSEHLSVHGGAERMFPFTTYVARRSKAPEETA